MARSGITLRTIAADDIRHLLAAGRTVELPVHLTCGSGPIVIDATHRHDIEQRDPGPGVVDGTVVIAPAPHPTIILDRTECSCMTFHETQDCDHRIIARDVIEGHLADHPEGPADQTEDRAPHSHTREEYLPSVPVQRQAVLELPAGSPSTNCAPRPDASTWTYSEDPRRFATDCRAALARRGDEHGGIPYITDSPAIYGHGDDRPFQIEIEYSAPNPSVARTYPQFEDTDQASTQYAVPHVGASSDDEALPGLGTGEITASRYIAGRGWEHSYRHVPVNAAGDHASQAQILNAGIGKALHQQGILDDPVIRGFQPTAHAGVARERWTLEAAATADGRAVSPLQLDTPSSWADLAAVCRQITEHGGDPAMAGTYVAVAAPDFAANPEAITNLQRLLLVCEDDLYRMASNPHTPSRIARFCRPLQERPTLGFGTATHTAGARPPVRRPMVDFTGLDRDDPASSYLLFRLFDGSLQPGRIQAQIKLALAATDFAARHEISPLEPRVRLGNGITRQRVLRTHAEWFDPITTSGIRRLIDQLFQRDEDKQQIAALWAVSTYQTNPVEEAS
ncbi:hypothetical protein ACFV9C_42635 [Kribbella sp. NPDC059898]|uniref:hypothetical protein n=1 Tax=Kribbella sp. NPDC059898 TaxID=3346995 RepID=UPI00365FDEBF